MLNTKWFICIIFLFIICCLIKQGNSTAQFTTTSPTLYLLEDTTVPRVIYTVVVYSDSSSTSGFTFSTSACDTVFSLTAANSNNERNLNLITALDYETAQTKSCTITASDGGSSSLTVTVSVMNVFDVAPVFPAATATVSCAEEAIASCTFSTSMVPTDTETGAIYSADKDVLTCSITTASVYVEIDPTNCAISTPTKIDRDTLAADSFIIDIKVVDRGGNSATASLTISITDINDNAPTCTKMAYFVSIPENTVVNTAVATVATCTDIDKGPNNNVFTYNIVGTSVFTVDSSGVIKLTTAQDYDIMATNPLVFTVELRDGGTSALTGTASITVAITGINDNSPVWGAWSSWTPPLVGTYIKTVAENSASGTSLFIAKASDGDKAGEPASTIDFSCTAAVDDNGNNVLQDLTCDMISGEVKLADSSAFNRESMSYIVVTVMAKDKETPFNSISTSVSVSVSGVDEFAPKFGNADGVFSVTINEGTAANVDVQDLQVTDADKSTPAETITCTLTDTWFKISGLIVQTKAIIEPDQATNAPTSYALYPVCNDGSLSSTATVFVTVKLSNDYTPTLTGSLASSSIAENTAVSTVIGTMTAGDLDAGNDGVVTCSLSSPVDGPFYLDKCTKIILGTSLDYETTQSYSIIVIATDGGTAATGGAKSISLSLSLTITDVDDNSPICASASYSASLPEGTVSGSNVVKVSCPDKDSAGVTYSIVTTSVPFAIDTAGQITTTGALNYESTATYNLIIKSTDQANAAKTATTLVVVEVTNVNEFTPTFTDTSVNILESKAAGTKITTFAATDNDAGSFGTITYSIDSVDNSGSSFFAVVAGGDVYLVSSIDYESIGATKQFVITIRGVDGGTLAGTGKLTVVVDDVNDNTPICTKSEFSVSFVENTGASVLGTGDVVSATDADSSTSNNNVVRYTLASGGSGNFVVDSVTGEIKTSATPSLDYETTRQYNLQIKAQDGAGTGTYSTTCTVIVTITNLNENPPVFSPSSQTKQIYESDPPGTVIVTVSATDTDYGTIILYSISPAVAQFNINPNSGQITLDQYVDYETVLATPFVIYVEASDQGGKSATATVTVSVLDANEFPPVCQQTDMIVDVAEAGTPPISIATLSCSDQDTAQTLSYSVYSVDGSTVTPFTYSFAGSALSTSVVLNYEAATTHTIVAKVMDSGTYPAQSSISVTISISVLPVNEFNPTITGPAALTVAENQPVDYVLSTNVVATDADQGSTDATITYSILSGNTNNYFKIDSSTGAISVANPLDREAFATISLVVKATDGGGLFGTSTIPITISDVNDNAPVFTPNSYSLTISSSASIGTQLNDFTSKFSDADSTPTPTLSLQAAGNTNTDFILSGNILQTQYTLNYATTPSYSLQVVATDTVYSTYCTIIVTVTPANSNNPSITSGAGPGSWPETTSVGTLLYTFTATDADPGLSGTITYSINSGNTNNAMYMDSQTGQITLAKAFDYETIQTYVLVLYATDSGSTPRTGSLTYTMSVTDVNDNYPIFQSPFAYSLVENVAVGTLVATITATDSDTTLAFRTVTISLMSQSGNPAIFTFTPASGQLTIATSPDYEVENYYTLLFKAVDAGTPIALTTYQLYTITITDQNDNDPVFSPTTLTVMIPENQASGYVVGTYTATDVDTGSSGTAGLVYSLVFVSPGTQPFTIGSANGQMQTNAILDRETTATYVTRVEARDSGATFRTGSLTLSIFVTDANDNPPVLSGNPYSGTISEGPTGTGGTVAFTVVASDADEGLNAALRYRITNGNAAGLFDINNQGQVFLIVGNTLDRETVSQYALTIEVYDLGSAPTHTVATTGTVYVADINDNAPVFAAAGYILSVYENSAVNTLVSTPVTATDADGASPNNAIVYSMSMISGSQYFQVNPNTGQFSVLVASLDRETLDTYVVLLLATDQGTPSLTGSTTVTISILDENDNNPVFPASYTFSFYENVTVPYTIGQVKATDADLSAAGTVTYAMIVPATASSYISVYASGSFALTTAVDRELVSGFVFKIMGTDGGTPARSSSVTVTIYILDANDNAPVWTKPLYNGEIAYNDSRSTKVVTTKATDADATGNVITYTWASVSNYFDILGSTGVVQRAITDQKMTSGGKVILTARATDSDPAPRQTDVYVRVDAYDPSTQTVCMTLVTSETAFTNSLSTILLQLSTSIASFYPTARAGLYKEKIDSSSDNSWVLACFYVVADNSTDAVSGINSDKSFLSSSTLLAYWRQSASGETPSQILTRALNITALRVMPYQNSGIDDDSLYDNSLWYQQPWGIAVLVVSSIVGAAIIGLSIFGIYTLSTKASSSAVSAGGHSSSSVTQLISRGANKPSPSTSQPPTQIKSPFKTVPKTEMPSSSNSLAPKEISPAQKQSNPIWQDRNIWKGTPTPIFGKSNGASLTPVNVDQIHI